VQTF